MRPNVRATGSAWLVLALLAAGCSRPPAEDPAAATLVWRQKRDPSSLDPARAGVERAQVVVRRLHDGMLAPDPATGEPVPALAERWDVDPGGRRYVFHLRRGVRFHDGRELTSSDVVYSLSRHFDPDVPSSLRPYLQNVEGGRERLEGRASSVSGIAAPDPATVEIRLVRPFAPLLGVLSMAQAAIVPAGSVADGEGGFPGTGAYRFDRWERGRYLALAAFADHWRGAPAIAAIRFRFVDGEDTALAQFEAGEIDLLNAVPPGRREEIARDRAGYRTEVIGIFGLGINHDGPLGANRELRRAIASAVDRDYAAHTYGRGRDRPAPRLLRAGTPGADPALPGLRFDLQETARLLVEAGFPGGEGLAPLRAISPAGDPGPQRVLERLAADLATVGVQLEVESMEFATFAALLDGGAEAMQEVDLYRLAWYPDYVDPDALLTPLLDSASIGSGGANVSYRDPEIDGLLDRARSTLEGAARAGLYRAIERRALQEVALIPVYWLGDELLASDRVEGIVLGPLGETVIPVERMRLRSD